MEPGAGLAWVQVSELVSQGWEDLKKASGQAQGQPRRAGCIRKWFGLARRAAWAAGTQSHGCVCLAAVSNEVPRVHTPAVPSAPANRRRTRQQSEELKAARATRSSPPRWPGPFCHLRFRLRPCPSRAASGLTWLLGVPRSRYLSCQGLLATLEQGRRCPPV